MIKQLLECVQAGVLTTPDVYIPEPEEGPKMTKIEKKMAVKILGKMALSPNAKGKSK
jgi:hypothetical protein